MKSAADTPRWQFRLRHIFGLTTVAAIAAALIAARGLHTVGASLGIFIAWLNWCGAFRGIQATGGCGRRFADHGLTRESAVLWLAWALFLVSLALPSIRVFGPVIGAWAAWYAVALPAEAIWKKEVGLQPAFLLFYSSIDLANLLMVLLPLLIWLRSRGRGTLVAGLLCLAMPAAWAVPWSSDLLIGYYVWCASFFIALAALPLRTPVFLGMTSLAAGLAVLVK
jgi:hypothetical protein